MSGRDSSAQPPAGPGADRERLAASLREALGELGDVFGDLVHTAEAKAFVRCPYMNVKRECTAQFDCLNQVFLPHRERALCSGQHKINFACQEAQGDPDDNCLE